MMQVTWERAQARLKMRRPQQQQKRARERAHLITASRTGLGPN